MCGGRRQKRKARGCCMLILVLLLLVLLAVFVIGAFFWGNVEDAYMNWRYPLLYGSLIHHYSALHELDPYFVMGVIFTESSFRSDAISPAGAAGLMQIMPATGEWIAERIGHDLREGDLLEPSINIRLGTYYLRMLIDMFEEKDTALAAYNAGMGNVRRWLDDARYSSDGRTLHTIPFRETRDYVERVNRHWEIYWELYADEVVRTYN